MSRSFFRTFSRGLLPALLLPLPSLLACEQLDEIKDTVDGLTNPLVAVGLHLGVEPPESDVINLEATPFASGASVRVLLADASDPSELDDTPVKGASVGLVSDSNGGRFDLEDQGDGSYTAKGDDGLSYAAEAVRVAVTLDDGDHAIGVAAPAAPQAGVAETHAQGQPMAIDISDQDYDGALVIVMDLDGGVTWSNQPDTATEIYEFTHGSSDELTQVEIPAQAFATTGLYTVAVAGTRNSTTDDMEEVNTAVSTLVAGKFRFYPVDVE